MCTREDFGQRAMERIQGEETSVFYVREVGVRYNGLE